MEIKNYTLLGEEFIESLNSRVYSLEHDETKARVLYIENDDEIMTFGIGFKTPPKDSTGVAHILEHCVLSGSRKYRTKEPFMSLINSSMQTFLNAMTFPDKTIYPVATRNEKDFFNLMDVYLDAVFYPRIAEVPEIFKQEGWRYELEDNNSDLKINGVVYNEMRGAYSDSDSQVFEQFSKLHPESTYDLDSGGYPFDIPDLTYENFLDFHKKYYNPSNSYIFLNGKMDIKKVLEYIDSEYLSNFSYKKPESLIELGESFEEPRCISLDYSVGKDDPTDNKAYYVYGVELGLGENLEDRIMAKVLSDIILESDSSILKDELLESGLAEDYFTYVSENYFQDLFIVAKGASGDDLEKFVFLIEKKLRDAYSQGIDKKLIESVINQYEFKAKEFGIHKGVILGISALASWLYGTDPIDSLKLIETLDSLKEKIDDGYLEKYIHERILNNTQKIYILSSPKQGLFSEKDRELKEKLEEYKKSLDEYEIDKLISDTRKLTEYQLKEDTKEDKDTIPKLTKDDISKGVLHLNTKVEENEFPSIYTDEFTNGIIYFNLAFNIKNLTKEELKLVPMVTSLIGSLDTENYSYKDLNTEIDIHTGGIGIRPGITQIKDKDEFYLNTVVSGRALSEKTEKLLELTEEIILRTKFENKKRIKDLLTIDRSNFESYIEQSGNSFAMNEVSAMIDKSSYTSNILGGLSYYNNLKNLLDNFDDSTISDLKSVYEKLFTNKITLSVAGDKEEYQKINNWANKLYRDLPEFSENLEINIENFNSIAYKNASNVDYVSQGFDFKNLGYTDSGKMRVMTRILSGEYLHTQIRAKGGAYGAGITIQNRKNITTFSYRDPNLDKTIEVYQNIPEFLENLNISEKEVTDFIIASMNQFDPPITPMMYSAIALSRYMSGFGEKELEKMKEEAINTTLSDIKSFSEIFRKAEDIKTAVIGSEEIIENSEFEFEREEFLNK